jgi:hypothetical protein
VHSTSRSITARLAALCTAALVTAGITTTTGAAPSHASEPTLDDLVSANPRNWTPNVNDGRVMAMVQVDDRIIAVGSFTSVTAAASAGGETFTRNNIFAFDAETGVIDTSFVPDVGTKEVYDIADAGDGTIYIGGAFSSVNGLTMTAKIAHLKATTGTVLKKFKAPQLSGKVTDLQLANGNLYVGGKFTTVAKQPRTLLAALDPITGDDTGAVDFTFTDTWNGGAIGVAHFDISDDGSTLVAVGNWRNVDGESRPQIMMADLTATTSTLSDWATDRFAFDCQAKFDTYLRDVDIAPAGDYFAVATTGGYWGGDETGPLCDSVSRWELGPTTAGQDPSWVDRAGGDALTQVKVTGSVIYVGGHVRWLNSPYTKESTGDGAVSREGIAALDPRNGLPFSWNPTRGRKVGVEEFMTTSAGLWVGHDSNRAGGEIRKRIALFPTAGGSTLPLDDTGVLADGVYLLGQSANITSGHWVTRVNVGGPVVHAIDDGPDWSADDDDQASSWRTGGGTRTAPCQCVIVRASSVPDTTPSDIFATNLWSGSLNYDVPADAGHSLTVRLYFENTSTTSNYVGARSFSVTIDDQTKLASYDVVAEVGSDVADMQEFTITSDGNVDIDLQTTNRSGGPILNGLEIIDNTVPLVSTSPDDRVFKRSFKSAKVTGSTAVSAGGVAWDDTRGAVMIDDTLYTGWSDGTLQARTFNGKKFGTATEVDLNGLTDFAATIPDITGMFFDSATGRLYYSEWGQSTLYYRYFEPESQIVGAVEFTGPASGNGINWRTASGLFLVDDTLYVASSLTGDLQKVGWESGNHTNAAWDIGSLSGTATVVSGPSLDDGYDWRARGSFIYAG